MFLQNGLGQDKEIYSQVKNVWLDSTYAMLD